VHAALRNRTCQGLDRQGQGQGPSLQKPGQGHRLDLQGQGQVLTSLVRSLGPTKLPSPAHFKFPHRRRWNSERTKVVVCRTVTSRPTDCALSTPLGYNLHQTFHTTTVPEADYPKDHHHQSDSSPCDRAGGNRRIDLRCS